VAVESEGEGRGATFRVELPASRNAPAWRAAPVGARENLHGLHALVVDDRPDERELLGTILERHGARVTTADSVRRALDAIAEARPDVLITDIAMPGEDGYVLLRRVRELGPAQGAGIPAVAVTAHARAEDRDRALAAGFQSYVAKPIDRARLLQAIAIACGRAREPEAAS
jgi:CheY-like chemotaxis protein